MHGMNLVRDLAIVLTIAGGVAVLFHRLRQPVVLGYIAAGVLIGPYTPPFDLITDHETIGALAGLGVIFLMFSLGLEFRLRRLRTVGPTALVAATLEIGLMIGVGYEIGDWLGWSQIDSLFLGAMMSISSTTIIVKALGELGLAREQFAQLIFGILIVEDILAIAMLALLSSIAMTGTLSVAEIATMLAHLAIFLTVVLVIGLLAVPPLLAFVARARSHEMLLVCVVGVCFGVSLLAVELGYSVALGAFLIGAIMAESDSRHQIEHLVAPLRDLFSAVFFVTIGLMIDPAMLREWWMPIAGISIAVIIGKIVTCTVGTLISGNPARKSLRVGMGLAQIGEFSFIIASLGTTLRVTSDFLYPIAVAVSAVTTFATPYLIRAADPLADRLSALAPRRVHAALGSYTGWTSTPGGVRGARGRAVRSLAFQIALIFALTVAVFGAATAVEAEVKVAFPRLPWWIDTGPELAQLVAIATTLPLLVIALAKLRRLCALLARAGVRRQSNRRTQVNAEAAVARLLFGAASFAMALSVVGLSAPALPDPESLGLWVVLLAAAGFLLWRPSLSAYQSAHRRLRRTLAREDTAS
ncbi:MAG TPA: cation:proton antiporter [Candidatus Binatia bacterium]|nr:cation:proton antiporter [Candidatus Binatia bacterium]